MKFVITTVIGGPDAEAKVDTVLRALTKELRSLGEHVKSADMDVFDVRLQVSGSISRFKQSEGFNGITIYANKRKARANVTVHPNTWTKGPAEFRRFFLESVISALEEFQRKSDRKGLDSGAVELLDRVRSLQAHPT